MNYANLSREELIQEIQKMQMEGIEGVYLDKEEWRELQVSIIKMMEDNVMAYKEPQPEGQEYIQFSGMKFFQVEDIRPKFNGRPRINFGTPKGWNIDYEI